MTHSHGRHRADRPQHDVRTERVATPEELADLLSRTAARIADDDYRLAHPWRWRLERLTRRLSTRRAIRRWTR